MRKKKKFKPVITRVALNPEQAVLSCSCYSGFKNWTSTDTGSSQETVCDTAFTPKSTDFGYWNSSSPSS